MICLIISHVIQPHSHAQLLLDKGVKTTFTSKDFQYHLYPRSWAASTNNSTSKQSPSLCRWEQTRNLAGHNIKHETMLDSNTKPNDVLLNLWNFTNWRFVKHTQTSDPTRTRSCMYAKEITCSNCAHPLTHTSNAITYIQQATPTLSLRTAQTHGTNAQAEDVVLHRTESHTNHMHDCKWPANASRNKM